MKKLSDDFSAAVLGWEKISGELLDMAQISGNAVICSDAERLNKVTEVISVYYDIMKYACDKYDEAENSFISAAEV